MNAKTYLTELFTRTLETCSPGKAVSDSLKIDGNTISIADKSIDISRRPVFVVAVGKASVPMFQSINTLLNDQITGSLVITPDAEIARKCPADEVVVASHPVPDKHSLEAGKKATVFFESVPGHALVISLISGGTSSLMCLPAKGITIVELATTYDLLNNCGARIHEINTVRKHCSQIKGGQLLRFLKPDVLLVDLVISDVPGNELSIIGSGPTTADNSTFQDAYHILLEYGLWERIPEPVRSHIEKGITGEDAETFPSKDLQTLEQYSKIISSAQQFAHKAAKLAHGDGYNSWVAKEAYNEDVKEVATAITNQFLSHQKKQSDTEDQDPRLSVFYGESTVQVTGKGKGGRNQELALRGALKIEGLNNISWLSAGTDGVDGPTDAAGAVVDNHTITQAKERGIDVDVFLSNNDSYHFHKKMGTLLKTGPTGNNLMDIVLVLAG